MKRKGRAITMADVGRMGYRLSWPASVQFPVPITESTLWQSRDDWGSPYKDWVIKDAPTKKELQMEERHAKALGKGAPPKSTAPGGRTPASHNIMVHLDGRVELRPYKDAEMMPHLRIFEDTEPFRDRGPYRPNDSTWAEGVVVKNYKMYPLAVGEFYCAIFAEEAPS